MKCSLGISNFIEQISSLSNSIVFLYFMFHANVHDNAGDVCSILDQEDPLEEEMATHPWTWDI